MVRTCLLADPAADALAQVVIQRGAVSQADEQHDPHVLQLAFLEACNAANSAKAKLYYKQLPPAQQDKLRQICIRQNVDFE